MRRAVLLMFLLLTGCIPPPRHGRPPPPPVETPQAYRMCLADLSHFGVKCQPLPDRAFANGCSATHAVKLLAIGIPITNLGAVKCRLALPLTEWVQQVVQSTARDRLGSRVVKIESYGSFACRPINDVAGNRLSEHGQADAVDIAAFDLADGRRVTVKEGWNGPDERVRAFLHQLHAGACQRFDVVLGPDANAYHQDHFHFDMGGGRYCR